MVEPYCSELEEMLEETGVEIFVGVNGLTDGQV